jgi:PAS domain S-box-containing protein
MCCLLEETYEVTTLGNFLRDRQRALGAVAETSDAVAGRVPTQATISVLLDDLVLALGGAAAERPGDVRMHLDSAGELASGYSAIGRALSALVERGAIEATAREMLVVGEWVRAGLSACVAVLAADRATWAARDVALRNVFATAEIVLLELDADLRLRWMHDAERLGFSEAQLLGRRVGDFTDPADLGELTSTLSRVLESGVAERTEISIKPLDGAAATLLLAVEATRDGSGAIVGVMGASTDITELKKTQLALAESLAIRDRMMAVLAHDLRNPLSTVRALASHLGRNEALPSEVRRGLTHVESASKRMNELIATLLDFSAARSSGTIPMSPEPTDLRVITVAVLDELREAMPGRDVVIHASGDTSALIDPARIAQVVSNLAANALTHGAKSAPVTVSVEGHPSEVVLTVRNFGATIPADLIPVLFEPFRRGAPGASQPRGLGLGLFIARQIVRAHDGSIDVESTDEGGTVFTVRLPRARATAR